MYSDISTRIMASSEPNMASANALDSSVLPTPVGPKNRKEPMGRFGSFRPTRPLRMALATAVTASSWPMTRLCSVFSSFNSRSLSFSASFCTGILVHWATTSAISFSPILITLPASCFSRFFIRRSYFFTSASCCFLISAIWSNASMRIALSIS